MGDDKDATNNKIKADPEKAEESVRLGPRWLRSSAAMPLVRLTGLTAPWQVTFSSKSAPAISGSLSKVELNYSAKVVDFPTEPVCGILGGSKLIMLDIVAIMIMAKLQVPTVAWIVASRRDRSQTDHFRGCTRW